MNDLISRQDAIDALKAMAAPRYKDLACEDMWERDRTIDNAIGAIRGLPSAQPTDAQCWGCNCPKMKDITRAKNDYEGLVETMHSIIQDLISSQTEIIRCKECKWNIGDCCCFDTYAASDFSENGFCSSAERRNK